MIEGEASFDRVHVDCGEAVFIDVQGVGVHVGAGAVRGLMAYVGSEAVSDLLQSPSGELHERAVDSLNSTARALRRAPAQVVHQEVGA